MTISQQRISACRVCGDRRFVPVIRLPEMPFTDEFVAKDRIGTEFLADIEIVVCEACGSVQNVHDTDMSDYYHEYTYSVQSSGFARGFMKALACGIHQRCFEHIPHPVVLEIGSGTGEQLQEFQRLGCRVVGVEPSRKLADHANAQGIRTIREFFDGSDRGRAALGEESFDAIVTSYTFDHLPNPGEVLRGIHGMLRTNGVLVIEVHDLDLIRQRDEFCLFEHEHYTYLNERTMGSLLRRHGFEVETFTLLDEAVKRGNSLLVVARKAPEAVLEGDVLDVAGEIAALGSLRRRVAEAIGRLDAWLALHQGKRIVAYGAGGRGVMTVAALENRAMLAAMIDKNPKGPGLFSPKSHLEVFGIDELGRQRADLVLVFSYGYFQEIVTEVRGRFGYDAGQFVSMLDVLGGAVA
jgi:SAM-dependent methyltransferase